MYKEILKNIEGIEFFPIIALFIFLVCFVSMVIWVIKMDKRKVEEFSLIPLKDSSFEKIDGEKDDE